MNNNGDIFSGVSMEEYILDWFFRERVNLGINCKSESELTLAWTGGKPHRCKKAHLFLSHNPVPLFTIKISRGVVTDSLISVEKEVLGKLSNLSLPFETPELIAEFQVEGVQVLVRSYIPGKSWEILLTKSSGAKRQELALSLIDYIEPSLLYMAEQSIENKDTENTIHSVEVRLKNYIDRHAVHKLDKSKAQEALEIISKASWRSPAFGINDFFAGNILFTVNNRLAVIDWEHGSFPGTPMIDAIHISIDLINYLYSVKRPSDRLERRVQELIDKVGNASGVNRDLWGVLSVYSFIEIISREREQYGLNPTADIFQELFISFLRGDKFNALPRL